jgi:phosphoribosylaminoimidazole (AIR) synthetase
VLVAAPYYEQNILRILQDQGMEPALIGRVKKGSREVKII